MCPMQNDVSDHNNTSSTRSADNRRQPPDGGGGQEQADDATTPVRKTSMKTLITWNVSKALETNPHLDLMSALRAAQESLEASRDLSSMLSQAPAQQHLACAVLAWQQLGHCGSESLYRFITNYLDEKAKQREPVETRESGFSSDVVSAPDSKSNAVQNQSTDMAWERPLEAPRPLAPLGPVLRLPMEPKFVMRLDNCRPPAAKKGNVKSKIESACCMDSSCTEKLQAVDKTTQELRARAACLARREAARVEMLERAEAAWRDLELGYQRRLRLAEEKEDEILRQMSKLINERNQFKGTCSTMIEELTARTEQAESQREKLVALEKEVCGLACERVKLAEQAARGDALLADELCKTAHLDRELMFKEEQARRRLLALEGDADAAAAMTHEAERALHAELCALKAQLEAVSAELLAEDQQAASLWQQLQDLRDERNDLAEDLESCTVKCDARMQGMVDDLKKRREELAGLKLQEMDCHCKLPVDVAVEAKRTPSLAALCSCSPEQKLVETCSCTSLRSSLMSSLLSDLFSGLQSEMNIQDTQLPCQLLKCLEDKHNWDRSTAVKTRLRDFFSKLLLGELDIAIATAIEKYHVKWIGESCADTLASLRQPTDYSHTEGWQERALEMKAQKMATELAEQLFNDKAKELAQQAKDILAETGRPPCECQPVTCCTSTKEMFPCLVKPPKITTSTMPQIESEAQPKFFHVVSNLKKEIEDLKKEIIKREDLTMMEEKIAKMVQLASAPSPVISMLDTLSLEDRNVKKNVKKCKNTNNDLLFRPKPNRTSINRRKQDNTILPNRSNRTSTNQKATSIGNNSFKRTTQQFAVNMCLLDTKKKSSVQSKVLQELNNPSTLSCIQSSSKDNVSSIKQIRPIKSTYTERSHLDENKITSNCIDNCVCFHKNPSNTSIDKLLETLAKWKMDLEDSPVKLTEDKNEDTKSLVKTSQKCCSYTRNDYEEIDQNAVPSHEENESNVIVLSHNKNQNILQDIKPASFTKDNQVILSIVNENNTDLPVPTESEYMGAIYLDKSAENYCKCINSGNDKNPNIKFPFKCINSTRCVCKDCSSVPVHHEQGIDTQSFIFKKFTPIESNTLLNGSADMCTQKNQNIKMDDLAKDSFKNVFQYSETAVKCNPAFPDSQIKCLGITLSNINSTKKRRRRKIMDIEKTYNVQSITHTSQNDSNEKNYNEHPNTGRKLYKSSNLNQQNIAKIVTSAHDNQNKPEKEKKLNKFDESIDEPCVCCKNYGTDDLEVNTFQLLEEHLKGKLEDFKSSFCVPNAEEEKIYAEMLRRIKQLISESTNSVACKCIGTKKAKGSWNRAYTLLQEYLRTKIDRVKCQCESGQLDNQRDKVLPNVLNNISHLIENDFQRLKEICKYNNVNSIQESNHNNNFVMKPIQVQDHNSKTGEHIFEQDQLSITDKRGDSESLHDNSSKNPVLLTSNISAQVSFYRHMESKSCEAMKKKSHYTEVQTMDDLRETITKDGYNNARSSLDNIIINHSETNLKQLPDGNGILMASEFREGDNPFALMSTVINDGNQKKDKLSDVTRFLDSQPTNSANDMEKSLKPALSYIGYTMNCNCDEVLGCVCTKSTVRDLHDKLKIKDIWKNNTNKKVAFPDISYILESSASEKLTKNVNWLEIRGNCKDYSIPDKESTNVSKNRMCNIQINTNFQKGISLKKSKENMTHSLVNTENNYKNSVPAYNISSSYKRLDVFPLKRYKSEHVGFMKSSRASYSSENDLRGHVNKKLESKNTSMTCDCKTVPICHVKMLVANIEEKLANAECTCDSLSPEVCPIHSQIKPY